MIWITDKSPNEEGEYLTTIKTPSGERMSHIAYWNGATWTGHVLKEWGVIAWAPMPEPYLED